MFALTERTREKKDREHIFRKDLVRIGRTGENDLALDDVAISHAHAEIIRFGEDFFIRDLDSRNGIIVNEERVRERALENGDHILLGNTILVFQYRRRSSDTDVKRLIFQTMDEVFQPSKTPSGTPKIENKQQELSAGTVVLNRGEQDQNDLIQMAQWCSQRQLLDRTLEIVGENLVFGAATILFRDSRGQLHRAAWKHPVSPETEPLHDMDVVQLLDADQPGVLVAEVTVDARFAKLQEIEGFAANSIIIGNFACGRNGFGMIYLERSKDHPPFQDSDLKLITAMAAKIGLALETLWKVSRERELKPDALEAVGLHLELLQKAFDTADSSSFLVEGALNSGDFEAARTAWQVLRANLEQMASHLDHAQTALSE